MIDVPSFPPESSYVGVSRYQRRLRLYSSGRLSGRRCCLAYGAVPIRQFLRTPSCDPASTPIPSSSGRKPPFFPEKKCLLLDQRPTHRRHSITRIRRKSSTSLTMMQTLPRPISNSNSGTARTKPEVQSLLSFHRPRNGPVPKTGWLISSLQNSGFSRPY